MYEFVIERFIREDEDHCDFEIVEKKKNLGLVEALDLVKDFVLKHPDGYLLDGWEHPIEYEIDGAELSCWIDWN